MTIFELQDKVKKDILKQNKYIVCQTNWGKINKIITSSIQKAYELGVTDYAKEYQKQIDDLNKGNL